MLESFLAFVVRSLTGASTSRAPIFSSSPQWIIFANHRSHLDFWILWSILPANLRRRTRPIAARDYFERTRFRRFLIRRVVRGILIDRGVTGHDHDPLEPIHEALKRGDSVIIFPEGTRNTGDELLELKSGLYHIARHHPEIPLLPVFLVNTQRVLPKDEYFPVPVLCSARIGAPMKIETGETKQSFLSRAKAALVQLGGRNEQTGKDG